MTTSVLADYIVSHQIVAKVVTYFFVLITSFEEFRNVTCNINTNYTWVILKYKNILHVKLKNVLKRKHKVIIPRLTKVYEKSVGWCAKIQDQVRSWVHRRLVDGCLKSFHLSSSSYEMNVTDVPREQFFFLE